MASVTALQGLRDKGKIKSGQKVLIYGASGGVGTFAVQIAKSFGAEVTAVCSTRNLEIVNSIGADQTIDYTKEDFTQKEERYDLILGVNGSNSIAAYKRALKPNGTFVHVGGAESQMFQSIVLGPFSSISGSKKISTLLQKTNQNDLIYMKELIEAEKVKPVIDKRYTLNEISEAFKYFQEGHAQGKVVLTI